MIQLFKKIFGGGEEASPAPVAPASGTKPEADGNSIEQFVQYVVCSLVDQPDSVDVTTETKDRTALIKVSCEKKDIGKIIGRKGKTISAIRALANGAGGRLGLRVNVEVLD